MEMEGHDELAFSFQCMTELTTNKKKKRKRKDKKENKRKISSSELEGRAEEKRRPLFARSVPAGVYRRSHPDPQTADQKLSHRFLSL